MLDDHGAFADGTQREPFFGLFYWANGTPWHAAHGQEQALAGHPDLWTPSIVGPGYTPSELLAPLAPFNVSVLSGLEPHTEILPSPAGQGDGHMRGFMVAMTGDRPQPETFDHSSPPLLHLGRVSISGSLRTQTFTHSSRGFDLSRLASVRPAFTSMVTGMPFPIMGPILRTSRFQIRGLSMIASSQRQQMRALPPRERGSSMRS